MAVLWLHAALAVVFSVAVTQTQTDRQGLRGGVREYYLSGCSHGGSTVSCSVATEYSTCCKPLRDSFQERVRRLDPDNYRRTWLKTEVNWASDLEAVTKYAFGDVDVTREAHPRLHVVRSLLTSWEFLKMSWYRASLTFEQMFDTHCGMSILDAFSEV